MAILVVDTYVGSELFKAGEEAPEGVTNPAATDMDEWRRDSTPSPAAPVAVEPESDPEADDPAADDDDTPEPTADPVEPDTEPEDDDAADAEHVVTVEPDAPPVAPEAPPRDGPGASKAAWAAHAETLGLSVPNGASRAAIQTLVDEAAPAAQPES